MHTSKKRSTSRIIKAVDTTCEIIDVLHESRTMGVTELANELDRSKGTIHSHLATLEQNELVVNEDGKYQLSLKFLLYGTRVRANINAIEIIKNEVDALAEESGEAAQFMIEEHGRGVHVYRGQSRDSNKAIHPGPSSGDRRCLHHQARGKAILAHLPEERVLEIIDQEGLPAKTENTITTPNELFEELERIRERGVAFDLEETCPGLHCVAAPVKNTEGDVVGAVSVSGPASRVKGPVLEEELPQLVRDTANVIELNARNMESMAVDGTML